MDAALDAVADTLSGAVDLDALFGAAGPAERGYRPKCVSGCALSAFSSRASPATMR